MLMQMCLEDEFGQVPYEDFVTLLQQLRIDALYNAPVETDISMLRKHLLLLVKRLGFPEDNIMPVWEFKHVLLSADQICLSRMEIHIVLSILQPDEHGHLSLDYFLRVCCTVIPHMFDLAAFADKAATIAKDKADALAKQEEEELKGITASLASKRRVDDDDGEDTQANAPDRDAVEKALIHAGNLADEKHRQQPTLDIRKFLEAMKHESVQQCQLSEAEMRGFIGECEVDDRGELAYVEHIKTWIPILFELRKSRIYDSILSKDWGPGAEHLVDLTEYEELVVDLQEEAESAGENGSKRPSKERSSKGSKDSQARFHRQDSASSMESSSSRRVSKSKR